MRSSPMLVDDALREALGLLLGERAVAASDSAMASAIGLAPASPQRSRRAARGSPRRSPRPGVAVGAREGADDARGRRDRPRRAHRLRHSWPSASRSSSLATASHEHRRPGRRSRPPRSRAIASACSSVTRPSPSSSPGCSCPRRPMSLGLDVRPPRRARRRAPPSRRRPCTRPSSGSTPNPSSRPRRGDRERVGVLLLLVA